MALQRIARFLHFSDLHFVRHAGRGSRAKTRASVQPLLSSLFPSTDYRNFRNYFLTQGTAGHENRALKLLTRSIEQEMAVSGWSAEQTRLCFTGDLSTWGDQDSIDSTCKYLDMLARRFELPEPIIIYGNHDVWPGNPPGADGLPIRSAETDLATRRSELRYPGGRFGGTWMLGLGDLCAGRVKIGVALSLNSIVHAPLANMLALGNVGEDRYWEANPGKDQVDSLEAQVGSDRLAVIAMHHPLYDPASWPVGHQGVGLPALSHVLRNHHDVRRALASATNTFTPDPIHIILCGHTHSVYPDPGDLDSITSAQTLGAHGRLQLTIGSCAQEPVRGRTMHQSWQSVMLSHDTGSNELIVERIVYMRPHASGPFEPLGVGNDIAEVVRYPLG